MRTRNTHLYLLTISQVLILMFAAGRCDADAMDGDWPSGVEAQVDQTVSGNPLDEGDHVYSLRGVFRLSSGHLGLETGVSYAEPTSDLVQNLGGDAQLLMLDLSVVWYVNYRSVTKFLRTDGKEWPGGSRIKPELILFAGPGWASLRIHDAFPDFPLSDASKDFFTMNFGFGAKLYWLGDDDESIWNYHTSHFYLRPEVRARWFAGESGKLDWTLGLALGYSFGDRPSDRALGLQAEKVCAATGRYLDSTEVTSVLSAAAQGIARTEVAERVDALHRKLVGAREDVEEVKARLARCGERCKDKRKKLAPCLAKTIDQLNGAISQLRPSDEKVN